jgi:hypothetical protein
MGTSNEDAFWRRMVLPQEDRMRLGIPWHGGYRWFRSENVIPIEQARRRLRKRTPVSSTPTPTPAPKPAA